jgi:phosphoenolpyruvate-protein kinase (PTS system EI component)
MARFSAARERARVELQGLIEAIEKARGKEEASIFEAHQEMLSDPRWRENS